VKSVVIYTGAVLLLGGLIWGVSWFLANQSCEIVQMEIHAHQNNHFVSEETLLPYVEEELGYSLLGSKMGEIDLFQVERTLDDSPFIKNAEVYKQMNGSLWMEVEPKTAIARLVNNDGSYVYLDEFGNKFPSSPEFAANVILVRGDFNEEASPVDSFACQTVETAIPVYQHIRNDEFWNAQISEISIAQDGQLTLYPQIGNMYISFGQPVDIEDKFDNLMRFYKQVVKKVGWKKYRGVSVKYRGQVVGIKR
ncbi:MAG: hypothetical protein AAF655_13480, partial [Bacteroidota bacterium]